MKILTTGILMLAATTVAQAQEPPQFKLFTAGTFGVISEQIVGGNPIKGAPYSAQAVTETTQTLADGNRIVQKATSIVYRDSLGRERREESLPVIGSQIISISDPVAGVNYSLNTKEHVAMKLPPMPALPALPPGGGDKKFNVIVGGPGPGPAAAAGRVMIYKRETNAQNASNIEQLGWKLIEGVQAEGTRSTITIPAGQVGNDRPIEIVDEQWRSPDLQVIVYSKHTDPRFGETAYSLTNISRAEPAAGLFQVPSDYTINDRKAVLPAR